MASKASKIQAEKREFKLHKDILWSIIQSQAGTLGKAILELVMNSIDAGASEVKIDIKKDLVSVHDDGKGFVDRTEIEAFFETFGTPHKEGDATYGRFRMGRGQIMAFSRNVWRSGVFEMDVNIRDEGLNYKLKTLKNDAKGCSIVASLYDVLKPSEVIQLVDAVSQLCRYTPVPVFVNDKRVSLDLENERWSHKDDNAYYSFRRGRDLEVYNLGVLVRSYPGNHFGVGGTVVSKKQLNVNFARNDILVSKCEVWKQISKVMREEAKKTNEKKPVQDEDWRCNMIAKLKTSDFDSMDEFLEAIEKFKVLTDMSGKHYSFMQLCDSASGFCDKIVSDHTLFDHVIADKVHQYKLGLVLSQTCIGHMGYTFSFENMVDRISSNLKDFESTYGRSLGMYRHYRSMEALKKLITPFSSLKDAVNSTCVIVDRKDLTREELCAYNAVTVMSNYMASVMRIGKRSIKVCESETVDGFTDGESYIAVERKFLKISGNSPSTSFEKVKYLLLHEYCHDSDDSTGHGHPAEFYEKYHDTLMHDEHGYLVNLAVSGCAEWIRSRERVGLKIAHNALKVMDVLSTVAVDNDDAANVDVLKVAAKVSSGKDKKRA